MTAKMVGPIVDYTEDSPKSPESPGYATLDDIFAPPEIVEHPFAALSGKILRFVSIDRSVQAEYWRLQGVARSAADEALRMGRDAKTEADAEKALAAAEAASKLASRPVDYLIGASLLGPEDKPVGAAKVKGMRGPLSNEIFDFIWDSQHLGPSLDDRAALAILNEVKAGRIEPSDAWATFHSAGFTPTTAK